MAGPFMTPEEWARITESHGGIVGATPTNPYVKDETGKINEKNYTPDYKVVFRDGTTMTVRPEATWNEGRWDWDIQGWHVSDPGTMQDSRSDPYRYFEQDGRQYRVPKAGGDAELIPGVPTAAPEPQKPTAWGQFGPTDRKITYWNPQTNRLEFAPNEGFDEELAALERRRLLAQIAASERSGADTQLDWDKYYLDLDKLRSEEQRAREKAEQDRQQSLMTAAWNIYNQNADTFGKLLPYRLPENFQGGYRPGFEPGGPYERMMRRSGGSYNPEQWKITPVTYDEDEQMRRALSLTQLMTQGVPRPAESAVPQAAPQAPVFPNGIGAPQQPAYDPNWQEAVNPYVPPRRYRLPQER